MTNKEFYVGSRFFLRDMPPLPNDFHEFLLVALDVQ
jgi:hypothetical protein